jgi:hypothetical protein
LAVTELSQAGVILKRGIGRGRVAKMIINWPGLATLFEDADFSTPDVLHMNLIAENASEAAVLSYLWPHHAEQPERYEPVTGADVKKAFEHIFFTQICIDRINRAKRTLVQRGLIETDGRGFRIMTAADDQLDRWMALPDYAGTQA